MNLNRHNLSDPEIKLIESIESQKSIIFLSSLESELKYKFLNAFLLESLEKGKTFVFRVKEADQFLAEIDHLGLREFAIHLEKDTQIRPTQVAKKEVVDRDEHIAALKARISYLKELEKIQQRKALYNEDIFGKHPRLKLAELVYLSKKRKSNVDLDLLVSSKDYHFNQSEFWEIRGAIERAAKFYRPSYSFLKSSDQFCEDIYRDFHLAKNQTAVFKYLQKFINDIEELTAAYQSSFQKIKDDLVGKYNRHIYQVQYLLEDLEKQIAFYKIEEELAPLKKAFARTKASTQDKQKIEVRTSYKLLLEELNSNKLIKLNFPPNDAQPQVKALEDFCRKINIYILRKHLLIQNKVEEQLEILNSNNYDAPELAGLASRQSDIIHAINGAKLFKTEIHNLSISAWKNYLFLKNLGRTLIKERLFLEVNTDYAIYRSFEFTLEAKVTAIIDSLSNIKNTEWLESFETWYFQSLFNKYAKDNLSGAEKNYPYFSESKAFDKNFSADRIKNYFYEQVENSKDFNRKVVSEGGDWKSIMLAAPGTFRGYFPIIICEESFFSSEFANFDYDYLVCVENSEIPQSIFANSHFSSIICLHTSPISKELRESAYASKNYNRKKVINLKVKTIPTGAEVMSVLKNKITLSKSLTYVLGQSSFEKHFYSARDFSIITCLSPFCTKLLELELLDVRIKTLKYTHLESGIVEDVILKDDSNKYLVLQDGYIDPSLDIEWQINTLQRIENTGIKILMINTEKLATDKAGKILDYLNIPELRQIKEVQV